MLNFDRYNNACQYEDLINESIESIQLESERIRILANRRPRVLIYIDKEISDKRMLMSYYQRKSDNELLAIDPYLHYDLYFNNIERTINADDLKILKSYLNDYILKNFSKKSSKSPEEKLGITIAIYLSDKI